TYLPRGTTAARLTQSNPLRGALSSESLLGGPYRPRARLSGATPRSADDRLNGSLEQIGESRGRFEIDGRRPRARVLVRPTGDIRPPGPGPRTVRFRRRPAAEGGRLARLVHERPRSRDGAVRAVGNRGPAPHERDVAVRRAPRAVPRAR